MSYSVWMKRQDGHETEGADEATVRYSDAHGGTGGLLAQDVSLKASTLPDPPPDEIHVIFEWVEVAAGPGRPAGRSRTAPVDAGVPAGTQTEPRKIAKGDRVEVTKSRVSGVKSPPEWLEQYVGRNGIVLWTTADGAMIDLNPDTAWFSYGELDHKD